MFIKIATILLLSINLIILNAFIEDLKPLGCIILGLCYISTSVLIHFGIHPILLNFVLTFVMCCIYENMEHMDIDDDDDTPEPS